MKRRDHESVDQRIKWETQTGNFGLDRKKQLGLGLTDDPGHRLTRVASKLERTVASIKGPEAIPQVMGKGTKRRWGGLQKEDGADNHRVQGSWGAISDPFN